jgi:hypothetical protein
MALPTTALFDYPSPEALAYFIASAQVNRVESQPDQYPAYVAFMLPTACLVASQQGSFALLTVRSHLQTCAQGSQMMRALRPVCQANAAGSRRGSMVLSRRSSLEGLGRRSLSDARRGSLWATLGRPGMLGLDGLGRPSLSGCASAKVNTQLSY